MSDRHDKFTESSLEQTALEWFESLGWQTAFGPDISQTCRASLDAGRSHADRDTVL